MEDLTEFFSTQSGLLRAVAGSGARFLKDKINWDNRLIGIVGGRGTGKTTLLLQHIADRDTVP